MSSIFFFFNDTATTEIYTLSLHDALPISYLLPVIPASEECLLVPFYVRGIPVGTIWAIMHNDRRQFDAEDDRVMASLGKFASSAYQALVRIEDLKSQVAEREKAEAELRELTDGLEEQVRARTAELQRSEERLRLAQQVARIGTFEWNIQTGVNKIGRASCRERV